MSSICDIYISVFMLEWNCKCAINVYLQFVHCNYIAYIYIYTESVSLAASWPKLLSVFKTFWVTMVFCTPTILSLTSRFNPRKSRKVLTIPWSKDGAQIGHGNPHETGAHTIKLSTVVAHLWLLFFEQFLDMMIGYDVGRHGMKDNYMIMRRRYKLILPGFNISIPRIFFGRPRELSPFQRGTNGSQAFHRTEQTHHDNVLRIRTTSSTTAGKWHLRFRIRRSPAGGEQHRSPPPKPRKITWRLQGEISWNDHHHRHTHYFTHLCLVSETQWSKRRPSPQAPESFPSNSWSWVTLKKVDPPP